MNELQQQQLAAIRERRAKATPGPYRVEAVVSERDHDIVLDREVPGEGSPIVVAHVCHDDGEFVKPFITARQANANAKFFAHAWSDIDILLNLLADAEREREADVSTMEAAAKLLYSKHGKRNSLPGECDDCDAWELLNKRIVAYREQKDKVQK